MYAGIKLYISHKLAKQSRGNAVKEKLEKFGFVIVSQREKQTLTLVADLEDVCR
jgi:hypothetical protein